MNFRPHDIGTFLVESRSGEGDHILDINERTCSCKGYEINNTCQHLTALMNATSETTTEELQLAPEQPGEPPMKQIAVWEPFKEKMERLKRTAETLTVSDASDTAGMAVARATRLSFREIRLGAEERRKELVSDGKRELARIDKAAGEIWDFCEAREKGLLKLEQFAEEELKRQQEAKRIARIAEITPYLQAPLAIDLGVVLDDRYASILADAKDAHAARLERERKEKEESEAKAKAEAEERERLRLENERLKKEAAEREAAARKEREAIEAKAREQKELDDRIKADLEKRAADEKKAHEEQMAKVKKQIDDEAKAKSDAEAKRIAVEKKAAAAPDKEKLRALAAALLAVEAPVMATDDGKKAIVRIKTRIGGLLQFIEEEADDLGGKLL